MSRKGNCFIPCWMGDISDKCLWNLLWFNVNTRMVSVIRVLSWIYDNTAQYLYCGWIIGSVDICTKLISCLAVFPFFSIIWWMLCHIPHWFPFFCSVWQMFCHIPCWFPFFAVFDTCYVTFHTDSHFFAVFDRCSVTFHADSHFSAVFGRCSVTIHAGSHFLQYLTDVP